MPVKYWDYWQDSTATSSTSTATTGQYYNTWTTSGTSSTATTSTLYMNTYAPQLMRVVERYVLSGFDDWSDYARAVLTRLVNDETNTGFKIAMWLRGDVEITDPSIMLRDLDWFLLKLRQVANSADYKKIADHVAQVRAELASGMEAPSGGETVQQGSTEGDSPTAESGDAQ